MKDYLFYALIPFAAIGLIQLGHMLVLLGAITLLACLAGLSAYLVVTRKKESPACPSTSSTRSAESRT